MSRRLYFLLLAAGTLVASGSLPWMITSSNVPADSHFEVVASGLDNPRGLDFDSQGALYVAEAGAGGDDDCIPGPFPGTQLGLGATGAVTRVADGEQERIVEGLPSLSDPEGDGTFAFGPHDVSVLGEEIFLTIGLDAPLEAREQLGAEGGDLAHLLRLAENGQLENIADLGAYEAANNPDGGETSEGQPELHSNPNGVLTLDNGTLVVDSGATPCFTWTKMGLSQPWLAFHSIR